MHQVKDFTNQSSGWLSEDTTDRIRMPRKPPHRARRAVVATVILFVVAAALRPIPASALTLGACFNQAACLDRVPNRNPTQAGYENNVDDDGWLYGPCAWHEYGGCYIHSPPYTSGPDPDSVVEEYRQGFQANACDGCIVSFQKSEDWLGAGESERTPCGSMPQVTYGVETQNRRWYQIREQCGSTGSSPVGWFVLERERLTTCPEGSSWRKLPGTTARSCVIDPHAPLRDLGECSNPGNACPRVEMPVQAGNPIHAATGNKYQRETDYVSAVPGGLRFERYYNSYPGVRAGVLGPQWRHTYERQIEVHNRTAGVYRHDGKALFFTRTDAGSWRSRPGTIERLEEILDDLGNRIGWEYRPGDDAVETYDTLGRLVSIKPRGRPPQTLSYGADGRLQTVTGPFGRTLQLDYVSDRLAALRDPAGTSLQYEYQDGLLTGFSSPDGVREYHYHDPAFPRHLTAITNALGVRYVTWVYDSLGRAISSRHADSDATTLTYNPDGTTTVTDESGSQRTLTFELVHGSYRLMHIAGDRCRTCSGNTRSLTLDANGFPLRSVSYNGTVDDHTYDARGLETRRIEAVGTPAQRTIETQWHAEFRLPERIAQPGKVTTFTYDGEGRLLARSEADAATGRTRTTRNSYDADGLLAAVDGPRDDVLDVNRFEYRDGVLARAINALGHVSEVTAHDAHGRALSVLDPNGVVTTFDYDARGRLLRRSVDGGVTQYVRDAVGNVVRRIEADGVATDYRYDAANRLVGVVDARGARLEITLDGAGNRTGERVVDAAGEVTWTRTQAFDELGRLVERRSGAGQVERFEYDMSGNLTASVDGRGNRTERRYDALNRPHAIIDALGGVTVFAYDARDNLVAVTDPRGLTTRYVFDGLDDLVTEESPDSGVTHYVTDDAGNRVLATDARGIETEYAYDALGRLLEVRYPDPSEDVSYAYDSAANGVGRLASVTDAVGTTTNAYDLRGNLSAEVRDIAGERYALGYEYDPVDRLAAVTYPSGARVDYPRDDLGRIAGAGLTLDGVVTALASGIEYRPFGAPVSRALGNGLSETLEYDAAGRLIAMATPGVVERSFSYDGADNITQIGDDVSPSSDQRLDYDALDRLTEADGSYGALRYGYDALGNRTSRMGPGGMDLYDYDTESNRLLSVTGVSGQSYGYDAAGNVIVRGEREFDYDAAGRLQAVRLGGVERAWYGYNARGERSVRTTADGVQRFVFGPGGELLMEDDESGGGSREYVYLGDRLLALLEHGAAGSDAGWRFASDGATAHIDPAGRVVRLALADGKTLEVAVAESTWVQSGDAAAATIQFFGRTAALEQLSGSVSLREGMPAAATISAYIPPLRDGRYMMNAALGATEYTGTDPSTGRSATVTVDLATRSVTVAEEDFATESFQVAAQSWQVWRSGTLDIVTFSHIAGTQQMYGYLIIGDGQNRAWLMTRDGTPRYESHALTREQQVTGTAIRYYHNDHLGTPQAVTDEVGEVVWRADYLPFGETDETVSEVEQRVRFPGQFVDEEVGGYYNYQRWYEASIGRYLTADPIGLDGGINAYAYANGNSIRYVDPEGLTPLTAARGGYAVGEALGYWFSALSGTTLGIALYDALHAERIDDPQAEREWQAYKERYKEPPPPDLDECELLKWKLRREERLLQARVAWDAKWLPGRHAKAIAQSQQAIEKLKKKIREKCKEDC